MDVNTNIEQEFLARWSAQNHFGKPKDIKDMMAPITINVGPLPPRNEAGVVKVRTDADFAAYADLSIIGRQMYERRMTMSVDQKAYDDLNWAAGGFARFNRDKIDVRGGYTTDVSEEELDFSRLEAMEATYQTYRDHINEAYEGDERQYHLDKLDESYNKVFESNVLAPLRNIYMWKENQNIADTAREVSTIELTNSNSDELKAGLSNYFMMEATKRAISDDLKGGREILNNLFEDKSSWHDLDAIRESTTDIMKTYARNSSFNVDSSYLESMKEEADAKAKEVFDKYAVEFMIKPGILEEGMVMDNLVHDWDKYLNGFEGSEDAESQKGMYVLKFSSIREDMNKFIEGLTQKYEAENGTGTAGISRAGQTSKTTYNGRVATDFEESFTKDLDDAAKAFTDFYVDGHYKAETGGYSKDISKADMDFTALDKMEETYKSYREQIVKNYAGDEQKYYLDKLGEAYDKAFEDNIVKPMQRLYDDKMYFFRPDPVTGHEGNGYTKDEETMVAHVSSYLTNQASKRMHYEDLERGLAALNDLFNDKSKWHDTEAVKGTINKAMDIYSSHKDWFVDTSVRDIQKAYADAIAKDISDRYAAAHPLIRGDSTSASDDSPQKKLNLSEYLREFVKSNMTKTSNGMFFFDYSTISNLQEVMDNVTKLFAESVQEAHKGSEEKQNP